jgi:hypothetical protein
MKTIVFTIAFAMMTVVAFGQNNQQAKAANKAQTETKVQTRKGPNFVDKNKNGICDNYEQGTRPARGQGKNSQGAKFVDKNKDGVCDNYQSGNRQGRGKGQGRTAVSTKK